MLDSGHFDSSAMDEILSCYQDHPAIIHYKLPVGSKIIRSSLNSENQFHETVSRLSYPPQMCARTDRASIEGKPMFYGSIFTSAYKKNAYPRIFSALETTDILRDYQRKGKAFTTQSLWLPSRDLHLFSFPFSKSYTRACDEVKFQWKIWKEQLFERWPNVYSEFSEFLGDLIAQENHSCLYEITASTIQFILNESTAAPNLDGVIYPSVWSAGEGMNICLKTKTVDECVHFQRAALQCIDKNVGESMILTVAESYLLPDGTLKWIPTEEALMFLEREYGFENLLKRGTIILEEV
jgi:hypothetical protein